MKSAPRDPQPFVRYLVKWDLLHLAETWNLPANAHELDPSEIQHHERAQASDDPLFLIKKKLQLACSEDCSPDFFIGITKFKNALTTTHSITARGPYSVWPLVRAHLDAPFRDCIAHYLRDGCGFALSGTLLKRLVRLDPVWRRRNDPPSASNGRPTRSLRWIDGLHTLRHPEEWASGRIKISLSDMRSPPAYRRQLQRPSDWIALQWYQFNLSKWDEALRLLIHGALAACHRANASKLTATQNAALKTFTDTLDTARKVLQVISDLEPGRVVQRDGRRVPVDPDRFSSDVYCELCWRKTMRAKAVSQTMRGTSSLEKLSNRFCEDHNPSRTDFSGKKDYRYGSLYKKDLPYKRIFQEEVNAEQFLMKSLFHAALLIQPQDPDTQETRRAIYDMVHHSGVYSVFASSKTGSGVVREAILDLRVRGQNPAQIAKDLNIPRQRVDRHWTRLNEYLTYRKRRLVIQRHEE